MRVVLALLQVLLAVLGAAAAADDQKAEDATFVSTYAAHPYPLTYTAGYPYNAYPAAAAYRPSVYSAAYGAAYNPLAYHGLYNGVYNSYAAPVVHSLKKRDTAAAEDDQQADESLFHASAYAAHPYSLGYTAGYPYNAYSAGYNVPSVYNAGYNVPSVYSAAPVYRSYGLQTPASTAPLAYAGLPYAFHP